MHLDKNLDPSHNINNLKGDYDKNIYLPSIPTSLKLILGAIKIDLKLQNTVQLVKWINSYIIFRAWNLMF